MNAAIVERNSKQADNMSATEPLHFSESEGQSACFEVIIPEIRISRLYLFAKRTFDVVMSLVVLALLAIPMLIIALFIRIDSPGPALFRQERLGKDGQPFTIFKFRSMRVDAEKNGPQWADKDDPRCTKFGRILRKSRLDEIPQLWNILKGEINPSSPKNKAFNSSGKFPLISSSKFSISSPHA